MNPSFTVMAVLIGDIACQGDSSNWPVEPCDLDQFADPLLQSPVFSLQSMPKMGESNSDVATDQTIEQRNGDYVCEIFSVWVLLNAASMRRFCIITHDEPREPWRSWAHVSFFFSFSLMVHIHDNSSAYFYFSSKFAVVQTSFTRNGASTKIPIRDG